MILVGQWGSTERHLCTDRLRSFYFSHQVTVVGPERFDAQQPNLLAANIDEVVKRIGCVEPQTLRRRGPDISLGADRSENAGLDVG